MPMKDQTAGPGWVPVPDPTKLTTDAVAAAKADIEKLFDTKISGFRELVTEKFEGRDTALAAALKAAQELVKQQNDSNTIATDKAAQAFTKQIDGITELIRTTAKGTDDKISDIKERITIIESRTSVSDPSTAVALARLEASNSALRTAGDIAGGRGAGQAALWALIVGGFGLLFGLGSFIAVLAKAFK